MKTHFLAFSRIETRAAGAFVLKVRKGLGFVIFGLGSQVLLMQQWPF